MTDIHANARALRAALELAREGGMDKLIVLGDLLTYGLDVGETLDLVEEAQERHGAVLLVGNHDQLYFDLAAGRFDYYSGLPAWLRESVDHTMRLLDVSRLASLRWAQEIVLGDVLFAHANPYPFGDWSYINTDADAEKGKRQPSASEGSWPACSATRIVASSTSRESSTPGLFRRKALRPSQPMVCGWSPTQARSASRGAGRRAPRMLRLVREASPALRVEFLVNVDYDADSHVANLHASPLSAATSRAASRASSFRLERTLVSTPNRRSHPSKSPSRENREAVVARSFERS